jgi:hypothetical protein
MRVTLSASVVQRRGFNPASRVPGQPAGADRLFHMKLFTAASRRPMFWACQNIRRTGLGGTALSPVSSGCIAGMMAKPWSNRGGLSITSQLNCGVASASSPG